MRTAAALLLLTLPAAAFAEDAAALKAPAPAEAKPAAKAKSQAKSSELQTEEQKTLYSLGYYLGTKLQPFSLSASEVKTVEIGLRDSVLGKPAQVDLNAYGGRINELASSRAGKKAKVRKDAEKAFLEKQKAEPGAQVLPSGVVFFEVKVGTGPQPTADDTVRCHYEGKLVDGAVFDSSYQRGEPTNFPLKGVIPCWTEGIQKLKVGGKAKLICPSDVAYGDEGRPPTIPGGATLIFDVELIDIVKK